MVFKGGIPPFFQVNSTKIVSIINTDHAIMAGGIQNLKKIFTCIMIGCQYFQALTCFHFTKRLGHFQQGKRRNDISKVQGIIRFFSHDIP